MQSSQTVITRIDLQTKEKKKLQTNQLFKGFTIGKSSDNNGKESQLFVYYAKSSSEDSHNNSGTANELW